MHSYMDETIQFSINLSYQKFRAVYEGSAQYVVTQAFDGRTIRFPADILKPYLTRDGIQGNFVIKFDKNKKFQSLDRVN